MFCCRREGDIQLEYEVVKCLKQILNKPVSHPFGFDLLFSYNPVDCNKRSVDSQLNRHTSSFVVEHTPPADEESIA